MTTHIGPPPIVTSIGQLNSTIITKILSERFCVILHRSNTKDQELELIQSFDRKTLLSWAQEDPGMTQQPLSALKCCSWQK